MERKRKIIAALADLKQDIAGNLPVDILANWQKSEKTKLDQDNILIPYQRTGCLVSSDSSGLSKLTAERSLVEVMNIISQPKEIIYSHGVKIGGRGIGVWCADNTEMFYDQSIPVEMVVEQMAAAQKRIHQQLLQVGMAVHYGTFWELGGGMFGEEAEMLEEAAENYTEGKEIILSGTVKDALPKKYLPNSVLREDLHFAQPFYSLNYDDLGREAQYLVNFRYPVPFSYDFYKAMKHYGLTDEAESFINQHFQEKVVILIKAYHPRKEFLLDQLTSWVVVKSMIDEVACQYEVKTVKSNGDLGIFVADSSTEALKFAEEILLMMRKTQDLVSIGLAKGDLLLFDLDGGGQDIAGGPVNLASKISEDLEETDTLYVHESVNMDSLIQKKYKGFSLFKSGVEIRGYQYLEEK